MQTAACYIRVSTDDQLEYSPDSQLKLIQDYAAKNGIVLLEDCIFIEESGISGKSMNKRPEFMKMITVSKKKPKPFDVILLWKFSRFARNMEEAITVKSMLKKNDIDVISISEPIPSGPFGDLIERVIEWSDAYYLTNLSQEVKRGMKEKASRGEPVCPPPIGYDMIDGKYVPNADAEFVRNVFNDYLNGVGLRAIAVKYSNLGLKTTRGNLIDNRAVEYMLRNPVYIGKIRWSVNGRAASTRHYDDPNIMIADGQHEPIVSKEVFEEVQQKLDTQKQLYGRYQRSEQKIEYMLKGLVRCSSCGATLVAINRKCPSMQCHNYARGQCKTSHAIKLEKAEAAVIEYLQNAVISDEFDVEHITKKPSDSPDINYKKLLDNEHAKLARIKQAYQNGIDSLDEYKYNKEQITASIRKIEEAMKQTAPPINRKEYRQKIINVLKVVTDPKQTPEVKNASLRTIVNRIVYNKPETRFEVYLYI